MFQGTARNPKAPYIGVFEREDGLFDWHLVASNGEIVCGTNQGYTDKWAAKKGYDTAAMLLASKPEVRYKTNGQ